MASSITATRIINAETAKRQFVLNPRNRPVTEESKKLIDRLLLERLSIAAICRVSGISQTWIQSYAEGKYSTVPQQVAVSSKKKGQLTIQCDEMWSFVGKKSLKQWIWLAMDVDTREIVGLYVGSRSRKAANRLWLSLPAVYRQCAVAYTDFWQAYKQTLPSTRHKAVGKETGKTNYPIAVQLYYASTYCSISQKDAFVFQEIRESHWCYLAFYPPLQ